LRRLVLTSLLNIFKEMKVLILGSGGREHTLAWKLAQSSLLKELFIAPGNAGTDTLGTNVSLDIMNFAEVGRFALEQKIGMIVVGPEAPLVAGIYDYFRANRRLRKIHIIGPSQRGAMLEGSKDFANEFMMRNNIPTAKYLTVTKETYQAGLGFLNTLEAPYVLKADGLAAGKGVLILNTLDEAGKELKEMLDGKFGKASEKVVIEEYLSGTELSVFVLTDGQSYLMFPEAKDYKRVGDGDTGLNTGGMGAVSPVSFADSLFLRTVEEHIIKPTIRGLHNEKIKYRGFLYFGLMSVIGNPYVIEYNVRMGDPEAEVVLPRVNNDLLELFMAVAKKRLKRHKPDINPQTVCTVVMTAGGYPGDYDKGMEISNLDKVTGSIVFHAGTRRSGEKVLTSGGRVLAVSSYGDSKTEALARTYRNADLVDFDRKYYRRDIGYDI
jgi:phosphoribosylamine--glycine ligase